MSQTVFISSFAGVQFLSTQWREQLHMNHEKMKKKHTVCLMEKDKFNTCIFFFFFKYIQPFSWFNKVKLVFTGNYLSVMI